MLSLAILRKPTLQGKPSLTQLLVRVADAGEAAVAAASGFDIVELRLDRLREPELAAARAIRTAFPGLLRLSLDGLSFGVEVVESALLVGADELAVAADALPILTAMGNAERPAKLAAVALLAVAPGTDEVLQRLRHRVERVMLESRRAARLFDCAGIATLAALADACRAAQLPFGFSGALEAPDIARLLLLQPDVLGFDTAVRSDHKPDGKLLPYLLDNIRALIPRAGAPEPASDEHQMVQDVIFVRDFVVPFSIGAYRAEEQARQRVRFSVEAEISRRRGAPRDMRDVFSYDVILETIRVLAERTHVAFVETLAEDVASSLLTHGDIHSVTVTVEKLDVVEGSVGITVSRRRPT